MTDRVAEATDSGDNEAPLFRLDNERLAFRFTATKSDRGGTPVERLPTPVRLGDWLGANGLSFADSRPTEADLDLARRLREAIHRAGTAIVADQAPEEQDAGLINTVARGSQTYLELDGTIARRRTRSKRPVGAALGVIAEDAINVLGGAQRTQVKACENPACGGLYLDTSRGRNRRWCSMNFCGNRAKKAKLRGRRG